MLFGKRRYRLSLRKYDGEDARKGMVDQIFCSILALIKGFAQNELYKEA